MFDLNVLLEWARWLFVLKFQFFPLLIFLYLVKNEHGFPKAFLWSSLAAVCSLTITFFGITESDKFLLAVNCFIIGGGLRFFLNIPMLGAAYKKLMQATIFVWLFIVGAISTVFAAGGFIGVEGSSVSVFTTSLILLAGTIVAIAIALRFKGDMYLAGALPFMILFILRLALRPFVTGTFMGVDVSSHAGLAGMGIFIVASVVAIVVSEKLKVHGLKMRVMPFAALLILKVVLQKLLK